MAVRQIAENDASGYVLFLGQLDRETSFLLWEPDERTLELEDIRRRIRENDTSQRVTLVAMEDGAIVGFLVGVRGAQRRIQHKADLTMGVLQRAWGRSLGRQLLQTFEQWAESQGIWRLELTVMAGNDRAVKLYERAGFHQEGVKRGSIVVNGQPVDEIVMGKNLK